MAKGQVSEEELTRGLKGIGNFGGLATPRVQRDNPFRDSRSEPAPAEPVKTIDMTPPAVVKRVSKNGNGSVPAIEPKAAVRPLAKMPKAAPKERAEEAKSETASARKADIFSERVTLPISPEMRDEVERLARELQRSRTSNDERISANTVMRVAIRLVTKSFKLQAGEAPNNEEELFELVERLLRAG